MSRSVFQVKTIYFRALEEIKDKLRLISERSTAPEYREHDAEVQAVCELAERARDAVTKYQVSPDF
jgi:hypothetical protein